MSIFVEKNPFPLIAVWDLHEGTIPEFSTRIRMGKTSKVILVVKTKDGALHTASKEVKVTVGGCGG
jgi:sulfur-oxidizing protein SoxY